MRLPGNPGIDNTAFLFFVLVAAFGFFVTVRGDLPKWLGLFGLVGVTGQSIAGQLNSAVTGQAPPNSGLPALPSLPGILSQFPTMLLPGVGPLYGAYNNVGAIMGGSK